MIRETGGFGRRGTVGDTPKGKTEVPGGAWTYNEILRLMRHNGKLQVIVQNMQEAALKGMHSGVHFANLNAELAQMGFVRGLDTDEENALWSAAVLSEAEKAKRP